MAHMFNSSKWEGYDIYAPTCECMECHTAVHSYDKCCSNCGRELNKYVYDIKMR